MPDATTEPFYLRQRDGSFHSTPSTRGPWDERFQHGGPPSALLVKAMTQAVAEVGGPAFQLVRLTNEILKPVPIGPLRVEVDEPRGGRQVKRVRARLVADTVVMEAQALFVREDPAVAPDRLLRPGSPEEAWPDPDALAPFVFPFFTAEEGYHRAIDIRLVDEPWGSTPVRCWAKPRRCLVDDEATSPEEAAVVLADAESGMGPPVDPRAVTYLNPDLTVYFARRPRAGWTGFLIESRPGDAGAGLSESALRDDAGVFGRSAQALVLARR